MKKEEKNKLKLAKTVIGIMTSYSNVIQKYSALEEKLDDLEDLIADTDEFSKIQSNKGNEITVTKTSVRSSLEIAYIKVSSSLVAVSIGSSDPVMQELKLKYDKNKSDLTHLIDMDLYTEAYKLYADALPQATKLTPYATEANITELKTLADSFKGFLPKKRVHTAKRSVATKNIGEAIEKMMKLLNETIDKLVKPLEFTEPDFYKAYKTARVIVD